MFKGALFDLDGTIISISRDFAAFRARTAAELQRSGFDASLLKPEAGVQGMLDQAMDQARRGLVSVDFAQAKRQVFDALDGMETRWVRNARLLPGVADLLAHAKQGVPKLGLLTNSGSPATSFAVGKFGLDRFFDYVFTRDNLPSMKPSPDGLWAALGVMGVDRRDAIYVGDSVVDIRAAKAAGVKVASIITGRHDVEALRREEPDYLLGSLDELRQRAIL